MRTFTFRALKLFFEKYPDSKSALVAWFKITEKATWKSFADVKRDFPAADMVGRKLIFDIGGNKYRLIAEVDFEFFGVKIKWIGTHKDYDRLSREQIINL